MASSSTSPSSHLNTVLKSKTHPLILRNVALSDAPAIAALLSDHRNTRFENPKPPSQMPVSTAETVITRMRESAAQPSVLGPDGSSVASGPGRVNLSVVYAPEDGGEEEKVIGLSGFGSIKDLEDPNQAGKKIRVGDVGVMLDSDYRRRGLAAEAIRLSVAWGFAKLSEGGLQLDKITAWTLVENEGMVKLLEEKLGWKGTRMTSEKEGLEEMYYEIFPPTA